jgi:glycosyltransferase involved in cell wall biosynthesis
MRLAVTGFVNASAGSIASANGLRLTRLLDEGVEIDFFSKSSFVDPRPAVGDRAGFRFVECTNQLADDVRRTTSVLPGVRFISGLWDTASYHRLLIRRIRDHHRTRNYDLALWLGDFARGCVPGLPNLSLIQGPPGTDATSIPKHSAEIRRISGMATCWKWRLLAWLRLRLGLPHLEYSSHFVVGSHWSAQFLSQRYLVDRRRISVLAYPIDLTLFSPVHSSRHVPESGLSVLWLGRIIPRKRLDVFLDGAVLAIQRGVDLRLTVIGGIGFVPGYERLLESFPFAERLTYRKHVPRAQIPSVLNEHDILAQPSDNEDFGHSIAEAQACGLPVIIGATNGNADYLCSRDIHLTDDRPETFAAALSEMAIRKQQGRWGETRESRQLAEREFHLPALTSQLMDVIRAVYSQTARS